MPAWQSFQQCSVLLGVTVGLLIYMGTLGAEFVAIMVRLGQAPTDDWVHPTTEQQQYVWMISLLWNTSTTFIAMVMMKSLRRLVSSVFRADWVSVHNDDDQKNAKDDETKDHILTELLLAMERRFAMGALLGICASWNVTNVILGVAPQVVRSVVILSLACLWCTRAHWLGRWGIGQTTQSEQEVPWIYKDEDEDDFDKTPEKDDTVEGTEQYTKPLWSV